jgi:hypothetical protein
MSHWHENESLADKWLRYKKEEINNTKERNRVLQREAEKKILHSYAKHVFGPDGKPHESWCYPLAMLYYTYGGRQPVAAAFAELNSVLTYSIRVEGEFGWFPPWTTTNAQELVCFKHRDPLQLYPEDHVFDLE